jgi:myo-inositol 2-dehydrogenase/D-chiro-inositol 1-dehydrogenase/scyllo-inositol 2-dehydrogenase (NAD+)
MVDADAEAAKKACRELELERQYVDYREALQDDEIDAVYVVTPTVLHREIVVAAAKAGKHIFCEKPMAMDVEECDAMIEACRKNDVKLQIGFMRRFDESFRYAKERIDGGDIGDVVLVKSLTRGPSIPKRWMLDVEKSNGPLAEVNSHDIDTLRWYTGSEFETVYATGGNFRCDFAREEFPSFYDNLVMVAAFRNGMQGCIDGAVSVGYGYDSRAEVLGTKGVLFVGQTRDNSVVSCSTETGLTSPFTRSWRNLYTEAYRNEDCSFIQAIRDDAPTEITGHDGKMAVQVVNAGNRSIKTGKPVALK